MHSPPTGPPVARRLVVRVTLALRSAVSVGTHCVVSVHTTASVYPLWWLSLVVPEDGTPCALNYTASWDSMMPYYQDFFQTVSDVGSGCRVRHGGGYSAFVPWAGHCCALPVPEGVGRVWACGLVRCTHDASLPPPPNLLFLQAPYLRILVYSGDVDIATCPHACT